MTLQGEVACVGGPLECVLSGRRGHSVVRFVLSALPFAKEGTVEESGHPKIHGAALPGDFYREFCVAISASSILGGHQCAAAVATSKEVKAGLVAGHIKQITECVVSASHAPQSAQLAATAHPLR